MARRWGWYIRVEVTRAPLYPAMDTRRTLQVVLVAFVASSVAQNFQPQFQPLSNGFQSQRVGPQGLTEGQREDVRAQEEFRKPAAVLKPKRLPNLDQPVRTVHQPPAQVQQNYVPNQGFNQGAPQTQTLTRTQTPVTQQQPRPSVRLQPLRQPSRPPPQEVSRHQFDQPQQVQRQQFDQPQQVQRQQFDQPQQVQRQQFDQPQQAQRQQFDQPQQAQRQQFEQPTAQQVNQHYFNQPSQQNVELLAPVVTARRPAQGVVRTQTQQQPQQQQSQFDQELFQQQAENARYSFTSAVTDTINDQENVRQETRDGLNLKGLYSYSDGYFKRTVHYEADENGYRVIKEEVDAIGDGPKGDPNGRAEITSNVEGNNVQYSITSADFTKKTLQPQAQHEQQHFALTGGS